MKLFFRCGRERTATCTGVCGTHYQNTATKSLTHLLDAPASTYDGQKKEHGRRNEAVERAREKRSEYRSRVFFNLEERTGSSGWRARAPEDLDQ